MFEGYHKIVHEVSLGYAEQIEPTLTVCAAPSTIRMGIPCIQYVYKLTNIVYYKNTRNRRAYTVSYECYIYHIP